MVYRCVNVFFNANVSKQLNYSANDRNRGDCGKIKELLQPGREYNRDAKSVRREQDVTFFSDSRQTLVRPGKQERSFFSYSSSSGWLQCVEK